jgi:hypothetical protein
MPTLVAGLFRRDPPREGPEARVAAVTCPAQAVKRLVVGVRRIASRTAPRSIATRRERLRFWAEHPRVETVWGPFLLSPPTQGLKLAGRFWPRDCVIKGVGLAVVYS